MVPRKPSLRQIARNENAVEDTLKLSMGHARESGYPLRRRPALRAISANCPDMDPRLRGGDGLEAGQDPHY